MIVGRFTQSVLVRGLKRHMTSVLDLRKGYPIESALSPKFFIDAVTHQMSQPQATSWLEYNKGKGNVSLDTGNVHLRNNTI
jgi:hypothetical protein